MKTKILMLILAIFVIAVSCKRENENYRPATLKISLTDAPAAYDAVNIEIQSVGVNINGNWYDATVENPGVYNLLDLSNGNSALLLSSFNVPAGNISQMRLHLGDNNTIVVDSVVHGLKTPSGQSSGYKIKMNAVIEEGRLYQVLIDFDAEKSIVQQGNGNYLLKPVVYGSLVNAIGQIDGTALPLNAGNTASAWNATDTFSVFVNQQSGYFLINSLVPGSYIVKITANPPFQDTTILNVPVTTGVVTHLNDVVLHQ